MKLILYFPVVADGAENTLAVLYRADVIGRLCSIFSLALVETFVRDSMNTLDPGPIFKGVGITRAFPGSRLRFSSAYVQCARAPNPPLCSPCNL